MIIYICFHIEIGQKKLVFLFVFVVVDGDVYLSIRIDIFIHDRFDNYFRKYRDFACLLD